MVAYVYAVVQALVAVAVVAAGVAALKYTGKDKVMRTTIELSWQLLEVVSVEGMCRRDVLERKAGCFCGYDLSAQSILQLMSRPIRAPVLPTLFTACLNTYSNTLSACIGY